MKKPFQKIALIGKYQSPEMREQILSMANFLSARDILVLIEKNTAEYCKIEGYRSLELEKLGKFAELAVVLGGDGTMLTVARGLVDFDIPLVGINRGRVGFLTDISAENMLDAMSSILAGEYDIEQRILLSASISRNGVIVSQGNAMNDVVVTKSGMSRLIELEVRIDGNFVHKQRSDGLIVATPTGTTAYSLSAGGPILHPTLDAITLVPICPHTLSNRPITINSNSVVEITLAHADDAGVHFDGQLQMALKQGDKVRVARAEKTVSLLHPLGHNHYDTLREKLNWG